MTTSAVSISRLTRDYEVAGGKPLRALGDVTLNLLPGEVHGLLGPNGAGKTTLIKILSTGLLPTSGSATVCGFDVAREYREVRTRIAVVFGGERGLFNNLTARENLLYWAALYGIAPRTASKRAQELLDELDLTPRADDRVGAFSRGMKQRVHLARGLISDPSVVFLDEPTMGMDPIAAKSFRTTIERLGRDGKTVLLTTHDMGEAAAVCQRVSFINKGTLLATTSPGDVEAYSKQVRIEFVSANKELARRLIELPGVHPSPGGGQNDRISLEVSDMSHVPGLVSLLLAEGVSRFTVAEPTLEDVYIRLIKAA